jgi:hypothetical protein
MSFSIYSVYGVLCRYRPYDELIPVQGVLPTVYKIQEVKVKRMFRRWLELQRKQQELNSNNYNVIIPVTGLEGL